MKPDTLTAQPGMWSIRCYRMLMRLYPADFREELGESVEQAFRDLLRDAFRKRGYTGIVRLWFRIVPDFVFSIWQLLTSSSADYLKWYFRLRWVLACGLGTVFANIVGGILAASGILSSLISMGLPERWTLGGLPVFLCIGLFQSQVLTTRFCRPSRWIFLSAVGGVLGVACAAVFTLLAFNGFPEFPPQTWTLWLTTLLLHSRVAVVGFFVGLFQWLAFKEKPVSATRWAVACMLGAYLVQVISFIIAVALRSIGGFAETIFVLVPFVSGCIFGLMTAGPLKRILWPSSGEQDSSGELAPHPEV